jgi:VWFA-related protein
MVSLPVPITMRRTLLALALVVLCSLSLPAQRPNTGQPPDPGQPPAGQPPITFRVEINYVEIDAIVTDAQGRPVRNLRKEDFQVFEEGQAQTIENFSLVDIPLERPDAPLYAASEIEPDVRSNRREFDGRLYVLVLDDLHTHFARSLQVRAAAREFLERYFGANDVAAIVQTGGSSRKGVQEFTSSRARLLRAVDAFMGQKSRSATLEKLDDYYLRRGTPGFEAPRDLSEPERASKARRALSSLKSVADYLAGIRGRRKAVILFSEGIDYDITNTIQNRYASEILQDTQEAIAAATRANVSFYAVDPRGLGGISQEAIEAPALPADPSIISQTALNQELLQSQDSLRTIAGETGGFAAVNRNDFSTSFARIVEDNSSYYVLGYYSTDTRRDGRFRKIDVRVMKPDLQVRSRKGYVAARGRPPSVRPANADTSAQLRAALESPVPISGLGISVFAAPLKGSGNKASLALALEVDAAKLRFTRKDGVFAEDVEVAILALDDRGEVRDGGRDLVNLRLRPETHALVSTRGVRIMRRLEVPPGRYQLRVGVRAIGSGAVGSVLTDLDVPDFSKSSLSMSGLVLTSASASQIPTANPDPDFKAVLPGSPVATREFPQNDTLVVFAEVYDHLTKTPHRVAIKSAVLADSGTVVFQSEGERRSEELKGASGGYGHTATIPLTGIAPGRYVLRVEARTLLADGASAAREVEFRIK